MSNLRLINETSATNSSQVNITNIFSTDFDIYKFTVLVDEGTQNDNINARLINSSGSVVSTSTYDWAGLDMNSYTTFTEVRFTNTSYFPNLTQADLQTDDGGNFVMYLFNPFSSSSYTFMLGQSSQHFSSANYYRARKYIGVEKSTNSMTGLNFWLNNNGTPDWEIKTYGLRVDS